MPPSTSQAFDLATNREAWEGYWLAATGGLMPPALLVHSPGMALSYGPEQARQLPAKVYGRFSKGFDTPDLVEAKALLDQLS